MNEKHLNFRIKQCIELASLSNCPRRKFGALLLDPIRNVVLIDAYNGGPRGGSRRCAGESCGRIDNKIPSGTMIEVGCHHAEMNVICNAAAGGVRTSGAWLIVNGEPCVMCAKLIHHAGIAKVVIVGGVYNEVNGIGYLKAHGLEVEAREASFDGVWKVMETGKISNHKKLEPMFIPGLGCLSGESTEPHTEETEASEKVVVSFLDGLIERTIAKGKEAISEYKNMYWHNDPESGVKVLVGLNKELGTERVFGITLRQVRDSLVLCGPFGRKIVSSEKDALFHSFLYLQQNPS